MPKHSHYEKLKIQRYYLFVSEFLSEVFPLKLILTVLCAVAFAFADIHVIAISEKEKNKHEPNNGFGFNIIGECKYYIRDASEKCLVVQKLCLVRIIVKRCLCRTVTTKRGFASLLIEF